MQTLNTQSHINRDFPADGAEICRFSRRFLKLENDARLNGLICVSPPMQKHVRAESPLRDDAGIRYYSARDVQSVEWRTPTSRLQARFIEHDNWNLTYNGSGSFEDRIYLLLVEVFPRLNPCASINARLLVAAQRAGKSAATRHRNVRRWGHVLANAASPEAAIQAVASVNEFAARQLSYMPTELFAEGLQTFRSHLHGQPQPG